MPVSRLRHWQEEKNAKIGPFWAADSRCRAAPDDAPKAEVARRGIGRLGVAGRWAITAAIARRAQMRAAFDDLARDLDLRLARIVAAVFAPAARVFRNAAGLG